MAGLREICPRYVGARLAAATRKKKEGGASSQGTLDALTIVCERRGAEIFAAVNWCYRGADYNWSGADRFGVEGVKLGPNEMCYSAIYA